MHHTVNLLVFLGMIHQVEHVVEIGIVVIGQMDAIGVDGEVIAVKLQTVEKGFRNTHFEAFVDVLADGVHVELSVWSQFVLCVRGEAEVHLPHSNAVDGKEKPTDAQQKEDGQDEQ